MKRVIGFLLCAVFAMAATEAYAQTDGGEIATETSGKKYDLRPEFTARASAQFFNMDYMVSGGVNVNNKNTFGLMLGYKEVYDDATPADIYAITSSLYYRRYFHLGKRKICAFYIDAYAGVGYVYKVDGAADYYKTGDCGFVFGLEPGFRVRLYRNLHLFLGPTISIHNFGLHLGIGF
ncbi:MAG: hypothetical protein IIW77_00140 [Bacteroidaceae bacterium]|nr:hypothetical protein [Bacteroidaceae bacterium]